jgi:gamma-glutamylcyclotransferase (GGCT)/AIG2-like uncharacterized protein YtfP
LSPEEPDPSEVRPSGLLAAYGELLSKPDVEQAEGLRRGLRLRGSCWIPGDLYDLGMYAALVPGDGQVLGELYDVSHPDLFEELDWFQSYDRGRQPEPEYVRRRVSLIEPQVRAWVYIYNGDPTGHVRVESGDWRGHLAGRLRLR